MLICEAAGFDVVLIETVGVGQSEVVVSEMTDFFLVLMLAGAGDEIQGIKRGIMEVADCLAVNKADGDNRENALRAMATYRSALTLMRSERDGWQPRALTCSALTGEGLGDVWAAITEHRGAMEASLAFTKRRSGQQVRWFWSMVDEGLRLLLQGDASTRAALMALEGRVQGGDLSPTSAAATALQLLQGAG
jgi:LAO/AO transport system kinase